MSTFFKKKRLTIIDLEISKQFEKLSFFEKLMTVGGWDCVLNVFSSYLSSIGYNVSASDIAQQYSLHSGISISSMQNTQGIEYASFGDFIKSVYQIEMKHITGSLPSGATFNSNMAVHINSYDGGPGHLVQPLDAYQENYTDGSSEIFVNVCDPSQNNTTFSVEWSQIGAIYEFESTGLYGLPGYFGYDGGWEGGRLWWIWRLW